MSWAIGYSERHKRDIGYGVPAFCDHPGCNEEIDRGLGYKCEEEGCGCEKFYCSTHLYDTGIHTHEVPDTRIHPDWGRHLLTHESWGRWRKENPDEVVRVRAEMERNG